ncbi:hypothetical protein Lsan_3828 [Legionella santicrucis]|uniref:Uncharacterized protein n=1 Tax=Legionella santicrucis TaxID=45074 RepID=A0A0W0Y9A4_9GAMM|nr:hypothetical protein [Legionella santicrucis]KTD53418.1 hypothetical protein Lsan_3828 [Legionella santicrucis]
MMPKDTIMGRQGSSSGVYTKDCALLSLTPNEKLFPYLVDITEDMLDLPKEETKRLLDRSLLESHTVPVCIPLLTNPDDLFLFIKNNSKMLFDLMLTAWPFKNAQWGFTDKNSELIEKLVDIKYFPIVYKAITKPVKNTLDLSVTFAGPTKALVDYIIESLASKKMTRSEEELRTLQFTLATGIAIVTNKLEKSANQSTEEYLLAINDSKNYLAALKDKKVETLFNFYFKSKDEYPPNSSDEFLHVWFDTKTYSGMYVFPEPAIAKKYA